MRIPIRFPGLSRRPSASDPLRAEKYRLANDRALVLAKIAVSTKGTDSREVKEYCKVLHEREENPYLSWQMIWNIAKNIIKNGHHDES